MYGPPPFTCCMDAFQANLTPLRARRGWFQMKSATTRPWQPKFNEAAVLKELWISAQRYQLRASTTPGGSWSMAFLWLATMKTGTVSPSSLGKHRSGWGFHRGWAWMMRMIVFDHSRNSNFRQSLHDHSMTILWSLATKLIQCCWRPSKPRSEVSSASTQQSMPWASRIRGPCSCGRTHGACSKLDHWKHLSC